MAALLLSGCRIDTSADLFISDIYDAYENRVELTTPVNFALEMRSLSECEAQKDQLLEILAEAYQTASFTGCESRDLSSFATFRVQAALVFEDADEAFSVDQPLYLAVRKWDENDMSFVLVFYHNRKAAERIREQLPDEVAMFASRSPDLKLSATIHNDLAAPAKVYATSAFVDGRAIPARYVATATLARRDTVNIVLSDVAHIALMAEASWVVIAELPSTLEQDSAAQD